jgi:hypothetical protein
MSLADETEVEEVRRLFEGREAIYVEKGALHVKVSDIRGDAARLTLSAQVEEILTPGFPVGFFHAIRRLQPSPLRWSIAGGFLTTFSEHTWDMGYGGWSLFFAPGIVEGILSLALQFPEALNPFQRYTQVLDYLTAHGAYEPAHRVFPER